MDELKSRFLDAMSQVAATVNIITTDGPAGRFGLTVSAMSSVSIDTPGPCLLVCVNEKSIAAGPILENGVFGVNILHHYQSYISDVFAGRFKDRFEDKFACTEFRKGATGAPLIADALASIDCRVTEVKKVGSHYVIFGEAEAVNVADQGRALVYANRSYGASQPIIIPRALDSEAAKTHLSIGCFHTFGPVFVPAMIRALSEAGSAAQVNLVDGDTARLKEALLQREVEMALMYDFDLDSNMQAVPLKSQSPYIMFGEEHPLSGQEVIEASDLTAYPMISVAEPASAEFLEAILRANGCEPNVLFRAGSFEMMRSMVANNLGYSIALTRPALMRSYDGKTVVTREFKGDHVSTRIAMVYLKDTRLTPIAKKLLSQASNLLAGL